MMNSRVNIIFQRGSSGSGPLENGFLIRIARGDSDLHREIWVSVDEAARLNGHLTRLLSRPPDLSTTPAS
jgi:hypothetical protein